MDPVDTELFPRLCANVALFVLLHQLSARDQRQALRPDVEATAPVTSADACQRCFIEANVSTRVLLA